MSQVSAGAIDTSEVRKWKRYPAYKDSGIEWLGEIPAHWEVLQLRRVVHSFVDYRGATPEKVPDGIPLITAKNVKNGIIDFYLSQEFIREEKYASWMVRGFPSIGDVLVTTEAPLGESAQITDENIALAQRIILLKANQCGINNDYLKYHFISESGKGELWSRATGSTALGIKASHLKETLVTVPTISEQQAIASFLDRETAKLDALIAKKEQLIDRLQEKRTALISHALTKGLNPDVPMKDSGVEWLGEIPAHWEVKRLKWVVSRIGSGKTPKGGAEIYSESGTVFLRSQNIHFNGLKLDDVVYIDESIDAEMASTRVLPQDVLLNITGASLGRCSLIPQVFPPANVNQHVCLIRPIKRYVNSSFLHYAIASDAVQAQIFSSENGVSREGLNFSQVRNLFLALPTHLSEQQAIASFLDRETAKLDALISKTRTSIEQLKEYRTALISSAVTGKIDVREVANAS